MLIQEVENIVGLSKKSIRYYEDEGLLNPKRNNNKYREYNEEDINKLKVIKFLRELDVPISELKLLNSGDISLKECMEERIQKINELENNYLKIKSLCYDIIKNEDTFESIDINNYFENIRVLNKAGFTMHTHKSNKVAPILGAIITSILFVLPLIIVIGAVFYFTNHKSVVIIVTSLLGSLVIGILYNLVMRLKEIIGGEEDEASKY